MRKNGYNMGRDNGSKSASPRKSGSTLWVGILAGTLIGVGMAAGVALYLMKAPTPFVKRELPPVKPQPDTTKPASPAAPDVATDKSAETAAGKPRFEFYKVLTDKQQATVAEPAKPADKPGLHKPASNDSQATSKKAAAFEPQILQAGSFAHVEDAEKLKAKLAMLGVEANIQTANIPDKGVWYRVRLGPYKNADDLNRASSFLKQNGVASTPMRAQ